MLYLHACITNGYLRHAGEDFYRNIRFTVLLFSFYWPANGQNLNRSKKCIGNLLEKGHFVLELLHYSSLCLSLTENAILRLSRIFLSKADNASGKHKDGILIPQKNIAKQFHRAVAFLILQVQLKSVLHFLLTLILILKPHAHKWMICSYLYPCSIFKLSHTIQVFNGKRQTKRFYQKTNGENKHFVQINFAQLHWA